ncbi:hypothetical protein DL96DRAFT_1593175 [Flagelloscypha sp. PMI_526]|nr:hypothetical protein DL96DRAFT_1593175 [Flagelloscypha sp. PMI_526]
MFSTKNIFHLRISSTHVIPLYVYLDERHVDWMSERVLQNVLTDLRPNVIPKLKEGAVSALPSNKKQTTVDTHRGDSYQFAYFTRIEGAPGNVLIKTRHYTAQSVIPTQNKRKKKGQGSIPAKKRRRANLQNDDDVDMDENDDEFSPKPLANLDIQDDDEEKPKPNLRLTYQGFPLSISLCVVVEPWPVVRDRSRAPSVIPRAGSVVLDHEHSRLLREPTPLFLPGDDDDSRFTPAPGGVKPLVPLFNAEAGGWSEQPDEEQSDDESSGGMMALSQVLSLAPFRMDSVGLDEDDGDGDEVLFADADERKSL